MSAADQVNVTWIEERKVWCVVVELPPEPENRVHADEVQDVMERAVGVLAHASLIPRA